MGDTYDRPNRWTLTYHVLLLAAKRLTRLSDGRGSILHNHDGTVRWPGHCDAGHCQLEQALSCAREADCGRPVS